MITKNSKLFSLIAVVLSIIGYSFLFLYGYKLQQDIVKKKQDIENLEKTRLEKIEEIHQLELKDNEIIPFKVTLKKESESVDVDSDVSSPPPASSAPPSDKSVDNESAKVTNLHDIDGAEEYENIGFESLLHKDVESAIYNFNMSEYSFNGYKSVFEISRLLKKNKKILLDPKSDYWKVIYKKILNDYSWKMSDENKILLEKNLQ